MKKENPHEKHRQRVRREFLEYGFSESTPPHKIIEMLLFFAIPRKDTNEIAHALLNKFKTISGILEATPGELMSIDGIGENAAALIKLILPLSRIYKSDKQTKGVKFSSHDQICDFLIKKHMGFTDEVFALTTFNNRGEIINFEILTTGDLKTVGASARKVVEKVIERKAAGAVISHNHPEGTALPSVPDQIFTRQIFLALSHIQVPLLDHVIVADDDCISMAQSEKFCHLFNPEQYD